MAITLNMNARTPGTQNRIVPLLIHHVTVLGESHWMIQIPFGDCVKSLFPRHFYTMETAVDEFCRRNDIDRQNVIIKIEEEN